MTDFGKRVGGKYFDRGDPLNWDWEVGDFTTDTTWRDLDLSAIVPAGATAVHFFLLIKDNAVASYLLMRKNGNSNVRNISYLYTQVSSVSIAADLIVQCDSNRVIQYNGSNTGFIQINVGIKGWFI